MKREEFLKYPELGEKQLYEALERAWGQTRFALERFGTDFKHIFSTNQFYTKAENNQWTNGFWTGELWLGHPRTGAAPFA